LGNVKLNLAEYTNISEANVDDPQEGEDGMITRRYLMQDSKVNATLKVGIAMKQVDGDTNFTAPPLKSAMVIGGIAGIMNAEAGEAEDMPSMASKSREMAEAQDTYRRTLAATWALQRGEMPPDKLIEDLFTGGDGGKMNLPPALRRMGMSPRQATSRDDSSNSSDADSRRGLMHSSPTPDTMRNGHRRGGSGNDPSSPYSSIATISGRGSIEQQIQMSQPGHNSHHYHRRKGQGEFREITEFDLRDDLRSWQVDVT